MYSTGRWNHGQLDVLLCTLHMCCCRLYLNISVPKFYMYIDIVTVVTIFSWSKSFSDFAFLQFFRHYYY